MLEEKFQEIESNYNVDNIYFKGIQIWSFLRKNYYWNTIKDYTESYNEQGEKKALIKKLKYIFYGFRNWFRGYEYIFFIDSGYKIKEDSLFIDSRIDGIINNLNSKVLIIESPNPTHISINSLKYKYIVSHRTLSLFAFLFRKLNYLFLDKTNNKIKILEEINSKEKININYQQVIDEFFIYVRFMKLFFRIYKPKAVFVSCYYCNQEIVTASNELGIKTIEVQHGMIGKEHYAYNINKELSYSFFPNILLTFGDYDKNILKNNKYNPFTNIYSVGNLALEKISKIPIKDNLYKLTSTYKYTFSISTQYTVEDKLAEFIKEIAMQREDMCFLFSLRHFDKKYYKKFNFPNNIYLFENEYSCYDILKVSDTHITAYSTCALEALFFLKKVILININGNSQKMLGDIVEKSSNVYMVNNKKEFLSIVDKNFIKDEFNIYKNKYINNIKIVVNQILKDIDEYK